MGEELSSLRERRTGDLELDHLLSGSGKRGGRETLWRKLSDTNRFVSQHHPTLLNPFSPMIFQRCVSAVEIRVFIEFSV